MDTTEDKASPTPTRKHKWLALLVPIVLILLLEGIVRIVELLGVPLFLIPNDRRPDNIVNVSGFRFHEGVRTLKPDQVLFWRFNPNVHSVKHPKYSDSDVQFNTNERGERGALHPYEKPKNVKRIIILGDSSSAGYGLSDDETYAALLQKKLDDYSPNEYQVVNLACFGYTSYQNMRMLETEGSRYSPDYVVFSAGFNDSRRERVRPDSAYAYPAGFGGAILEFLHESRFVRLMRWLLISARNLVTANTIEEKDMVERVPLDEFRRYLLKAVGEARRIKADIVFLPISAPDAYNGVLEQVAKDNRVSVIDFEGKVRDIYLSMQLMPEFSYNGIAPKVLFDLPDIDAAVGIMSPWRVDIRRKSYFFFDHCHPNNVSAHIISDLLFLHITYSTVKH